MSIIAIDAISRRGTNAAMNNRIKELREKRGWSMRELAARAKTTSSTINKLEKGITRLNTDWMGRIAEALEVPVYELMGEQGPELKTTHQNDVDIYDDALGKDGLSATQIRFVVRTNALDQLGIFPKSILVVETHADEIRSVSTGDAVIVYFEARRLLLRQFVAPSILITNSSVQQPPVINMRLQDAKIRGVVVSSLNRLRAVEVEEGDT
jgi:transcriptional regulator with XRE-family HTH domain